jgi:hypothetical protein
MLRNFGLATEQMRPECSRHEATNRSGFAILELEQLMGRPVVLLAR